jgi:hypothetical protein
MLFLSREELVTLTGMKRKSAQVEALKKMNIPYLLNPAGLPVVESRHFASSISRAPTAPTWDPQVMRAAATARPFRSTHGRHYGA